MKVCSIFNVKPQYQNTKPTYQPSDSLDILKTLLETWYLVLSYQEVNLSDEPVSFPMPENVVQYARRALNVFMKG